MKELRKIPLPSSRDSSKRKNGTILESIMKSELQEQFSITDLPSGFIGTSADLPGTIVVFDLSGSSLSIRDRGSKSFAAESQNLFRRLTDIIYIHQGIVEKFPGDGISMHFPAVDVNESTSIVLAIKAVKEMDAVLNRELGLDKNQYRFSVAYGDDTIVTLFGSEFHKELISIGHAVNVAHKLEKDIKEQDCFLGMDKKCAQVAISKGYYSEAQFSAFPMKEGLWRSPSLKESWYGIINR